MYLRQTGRSSGIDFAIKHKIPHGGWVRKVAWLRMAH
jgi:hypothetical protein